MKIKTIEQKKKLCKKINFKELIKKNINRKYYLIPWHQFQFQLYNNRVVESSLGGVRMEVGGWRVERFLYDNNKLNYVIVVNADNVVQQLNILIN